MQARALLFFLCVSIISAPVHALASVNTDAKGTSGLAKPTPRLLSPLQGLGATVQRIRMFDGLRSSSPSVTSFPLEYGSSVYLLVLRFVQLVTLFAADVIGLFFLSCWLLSPDSTLFGIFEKHRASKAAGGMPGPLSRDARRLIYSVVVTSVAVPTAQALFKLYVLLKRILPVGSTSELRRNSTTATTEQAATGKAAASSLRVTTFSLLYGALTSTLGSVGFLLLNLALAISIFGESTIRRLIARVLSLLQVDAQTSAIALVAMPALAAVLLLCIAALFCAPTLVALQGLRAVLARIGLGWVVWTSLNLLGLLAVVAAGFLVMGPS